MSATPKKKASSLQALLDAQEERRGRASSGRGVLWRRSTRSSQQQRQQHDIRQDQQRTFNSKTTSPPTRNSRWIEERKSSRTTRRNNHKPGNEGPSYEERMAKIERDAIVQAERDDNYNHDDDISTWVEPLIDGKCRYYQDRDKRYPFYTKERGSELLQLLMDANKALLLLNQEQIDEEAVAFSKNKKKNVSAQVIVGIGQGLYAEKPTLRTKGVTWSTEEYSHPGLQRMYLRMKSIQRFTEIWALLERSAHIGVFDDILEQGTGTIRIAAIGGGPGYELLASKLFFQERAPNVELELISMDLCAAWKPYTELLGFRFIQYDINNEGTDPLEAAGLSRGDLHFCIVSCVMIYVTNDQTLDMFYKLVHEDGVQAILLSERGEKTRACKMMQDRGGAVIRLIDQTYGLDERQAVLCSDEFRKAHLRTPDALREKDFNPTFPNVPYEEHKHERAGYYGTSNRFHR